MWGHELSILLFRCVRVVLMSHTYSTHVLTSYIKPSQKTIAANRKDMDVPEHGRPSKLPDEMLSFSIAKSAGPNTVSPRLGALIIPRRKPIQTPHFLALTSRGAVPHISQDTLR